MSDVQQAPAAPNAKQHEFDLGYRTPEGYAVCQNCGAHENEERITNLCQMVVLKRKQSNEYDLRVQVQKLEEEVASLREQLEAGDG